MKALRSILCGTVLTFSISLLAESSQTASAASEAPKKISKDQKKYPRILEVIGQVENRKNPEIKVNSKMLIVDALSLRVKERSIVKVKLDEKRTLTAYGPTEFQIPYVSWEGRDFPEIRLESGALRFEVESHPFPFVLKSSLFEVAPPVGETIFVFDPSRALADAMVLKGKMEFSALNAEEKAQLESGQKVTFLGILDEGEISYDLLLQGRKIPKGKLLAVQSITKEDLHSYSSELDKQRRVEIEKKNAKQIEAEKARRSRALCQRPWGELNHCVWKKVGSDCVRSRCVADGLWKDAQKVDGSACEKAQKVGKCDY